MDIALLFSTWVTQSRRMLSVNSSDTCTTTVTAPIFCYTNTFTSNATTTTAAYNEYLYGMTHAVDNTVISISIAQ